MRHSKEHFAASSSGYATEQSLPALSARTASSSPCVWDEPLEPVMQAPQASAAAASEHSEKTTKREDILKPEEFLQEAPEEAATGAAAAATEHSEETTDLPAEMQMIYSIVNAFFNNITFCHLQMENILVAALKDETCLPRSILLRIEEVITPIFFHYPNGTQDRSVRKPRDTSIYIRQWCKLASMREWLPPNAAATEHSKELSKAEVTEIFKMYMDEMKKDLREDQQGKKWTYYKSCTEAKMRREAGHVFVANAIWTIGLPRLPPPATEQRLSAQDLHAVREAIQSVMGWLDLITLRPCA